MKVILIITSANRDQQFTDRAIASLTSRGIISSGDELLFDTISSESDEDLKETTRRTIEMASTVVLFWTAGTASSLWVMYGLGIADALGKEIVIVRSRSFRTALPLELMGRLTIELS
jgi:hypothetical protein